MAMKKQIKTFEEAEAYTKSLFAKDQCPFIMGADYWLNSQLSIARFSGGCQYNGVRYVIDYDTCDLVRFDCLEIYQKFYKKDRPHYDKEGNLIK